MTQPLKTKVLIIGVDPASLNPEDWGVTQEQTAGVIAAIAEGKAVVEAAGHEVTMCLLALDDRLDEVAVQSLELSAWDCVLVGGGLRKPPELLTVFERVVNLVHRHAPQATIAFNERPDDLLEAIRRVTVSDQVDFA